MSRGCFSKILASSETAVVTASRGGSSSLRIYVERTESRVRSGRSPLVRLPDEFMNSCTSQSAHFFGHIPQAQLEKAERFVHRRLREDSRILSRARVAVVRGWHSKCALFYSIGQQSVIWTSKYAQKEVTVETRL